MFPISHIKNDGFRLCLEEYNLITDIVISSAVSVNECVLDEKWHGLAFEYYINCHI